MTDTKPEVNKIMADMMRRKTGVERLKMGFSMFNMAKELVIASLAPCVDDKELRKKLFLRFYQGAFDAKTTCRILQKIG